MTKVGLFSEVNGFWRVDVRSAVRCGEEGDAG